MRILNLYARIGGNRKLWPITDQDEVVVVELNPEIAAIYQSFFPKDKVVVADAHQYLLEHYKEFDFIWSSPPCPTHSRARYWRSKGGKCELKYPDMKLYQEIIFLRNYATCFWVVENVIGYYKPLIMPVEVHRHYFWSNFLISKERFEQIQIGFNNSGIKQLQDYHGFDLSSFKIKEDKRVLVRNCVYPNLGLFIWNCAFKEKQQVLEFV